jgi:hypothetical protein
MKQRSLNTLTALGLLALVVANVTSFVLQRHSSLPESLTDPAIGFIYGIAIATTLLGVWRHRRGIQTRRQ